MKKLIYIFLLMTLIFSSIPTYTLAAKPETDMLRVGLYYGQSAVSTITLTSESGFSVGTENSRQYSEQYTIEDTSVTLTISNDGFITFGDNVFNANEAERLTFMPLGDNFISTMNNSFRGGIQILNGGNGKMTIVNLIDADEYVYGVIGVEMSSSWHIEALKAQAVCARNYALSTLNKHSSYGFDLCTSTDCQVYGGVIAETESTVRAGMETEGKYLMYDDKLVETLFFSCSGGHTVDAKYVWGNDIPYLKGVYDPYEDPNTVSRYNWSKTYTVDEIKQRLEISEIDIGDIVDISTVSESNGGYVYEITIHGTDGSYTYKNQKARTWMGADKLYSQRYIVTPLTQSNTDIIAVSSNEKVQVNKPVVISAGNEKASIDFPVSMLSATGCTKIEFDVYAFQFDGHGWGHGVGMSQYGAKGMAEQGFTYEDILKFYYSGAYLE